MVRSGSDAPKDSYEEKGLMSGYALPRVQFDYMMFKRASEIVKENGGSVIQGFTVKEVLSEGERSLIQNHWRDWKIWRGRSDNPMMTFSSTVTIGAGGYNCPVSRKITELYDEPHKDDHHFCGGYREY